MDQSVFEQAFKELPPRRKEVLLRILSGETDSQIATSLGITEPTVRKHVERISHVFKLEDGSTGERRSRRSDIVALVGKYKPELLRQQPFSALADIAPAEIVQFDSITPFRELSGNSMEWVGNQTGAFSGIIWQVLAITQHLEQLLNQLLQLCADAQEARDIAKSLNRLGYQSYLDGDFQRATFYLQWALRFDPDLEAVYYNLGSAYEKLQDLPSACQYYNLATQYSGRGGHAAVSNLARLEILRGNSQTAIERIFRILGQVEDQMVRSSLQKNLGWAYLVQGNYSRAKEHLQLAIELNSERASAHCLLAQVYEALEEPQSALLCWKNCLKCDSNETRVQATAWRAPELDQWQLRARQYLNRDTNSNAIKN